MVRMEYSGALGKLVHKKTWGLKARGRLPLRGTFRNSSGAWPHPTALQQGILSFEFWQQGLPPPPLYLGVNGGWSHCQPLLHGRDYRKTDWLGDWMPSPFAPPLPPLPPPHSDDGRGGSFKRVCTMGQKYSQRTPPECMEWIIVDPAFSPWYDRKRTWKSCGGRRKRA